jgi:hypothetical protein
MVGSLDARAARQYGEALAPLLADDGTVFVVSSDFCHWGARFDYTWHEPRHGAVIADAIEWLDRSGMRAIEGQARACNARTHTLICLITRQQHAHAVHRAGPRRVPRVPGAVRQHHLRPQRHPRADGGNATQAHRSPRTMLTRCFVFRCVAFGFPCARQALRASGQAHAVQFVAYAQSSRCTRPADSSVSYAAGVVTRADA